jgi:hypothetical protein
VLTTAQETGSRPPRKSLNRKAGRLGAPRRTDGDPRQNPTGSDVQAVRNPSPEGQLRCTEVPHASDRLLRNEHEQNPANTSEHTTTQLRLRQQHRTPSFRSSNDWRHEATRSQHRILLQGRLVRPTMHKIILFETAPTFPYSEPTPEGSLHGFSTLRFSILFSLSSAPFPYYLSISTLLTISLYTHPRSVPGHFQGPVVLCWPRCPGVLRCPDRPCCPGRPPHNTRIDIHPIECKNYILPICESVRTGQP